MALLVLQRRARSKISIHDRSLEIFNAEGRDRFLFRSRGPLGFVLFIESKNRVLLTYDASAGMVALARDLEE